MWKKNVRRLLEGRHLFWRQITSGEEKIGFVFGTRRQALCCHPMHLGDWEKQTIIMEYHRRHVVQCKHERKPEKNIPYSFQISACVNLEKRKHIHTVILKSISPTVLPDCFQFCTPI